MTNKECDTKFQKLLDQEYSDSRDKVRKFFKNIESGVNICQAVNYSKIGNMTINTFLRTVARLYDEEN